jgi:hypothetical protein
MSNHETLLPSGRKVSKLLINHLFDSAPRILRYAQSWRSAPTSFIIHLFDSAPRILRYAQSWRSAPTSFI